MKTSLSESNSLYLYGKNWMEPALTIWPPTSGEYQLYKRYNISLIIKTAHNNSPLMIRSITRNNKLRIQHTVWVPWFVTNRAWVMDFPVALQPHFTVIQTTINWFFFVFYLSSSPVFIVSFFFPWAPTPEIFLAVKFSCKPWETKAWGTFCRDRFL